MAKFCPFHTFNPDLPKQSFDCDEDDCAWWNKDSDQCAVLDIAFILRNDTISIGASVDIPEPVHIRTP